MAVEWPAGWVTLSTAVPWHGLACCKGMARWHTEHPSLCRSEMQARLNATVAPCVHLHLQFQRIILRLLTMQATVGCHKYNTQQQAAHLLRVVPIGRSLAITRHRNVWNGARLRVCAWQGVCSREQGQVVKAREQTMSKQPTADCKQHISQATNIQTVWLGV